METAMSEQNPGAATAREPVLNPGDRVSDLLFGLFMALTFVGAVSVAVAGQSEIRTMLIAALGCSLAWGLVDAVLYLVRTVTDRGRSLTLVRSVRGAADAEGGRKLIESSLSRTVAGLVPAACRHMSSVFFLAGKQVREGMQGNTSIRGTVLNPELSPC
jgi:hypothetical protein